MAKGKKTGGRSAGTPNAITSKVQHALTKAFDKIGGISELAVWAKDNRTEFYKLWSKMLPQEMRVGDPNGKPMKFTITVGDKDGGPG